MFVCWYACPNKLVRAYGENISWRGSIPRWCAQLSTGPPGYRITLTRNIFRLATQGAASKLEGMSTYISIGSTENGPRLWQATDLNPATQQRWLAQRRIQAGAVNLLVGDEGIGKSLLWVWIAAAVTTGKPLPEFGIPARDPARVIIVVTEDDWSSTVRPRLEVSGADLGMVDVICAGQDGSGAPEFPRDLHLVTEADPAPALVVVDAWLDTVPAGMCIGHVHGARLALRPWKAVATATDAAVLLVTHTNRARSANLRDKYGASYALRQVARLTLFAQLDDEGRLVVGPDKANSTAPVAASAFTIMPVQYFEPAEDDEGTVPALLWVGESDRTASQHVADDHADRQDRSAAEQWLREYLSENPGIMSAEAKREARKAGIAERTLQRARSSLGVVVGYSGMPAVTTWTLP